MSLDFHHRHTISNCKRNTCRKHGDYHEDKPLLKDLPANLGREQAEKVIHKFAEGFTRMDLNPVQKVDDVVALFAPNGQWCTGTRCYVGHEAIRQFLLEYALGKYDTDQRIEVINIYWDSVKRAVLAEWQWNAKSVETGLFYQQDDLNIAKLDCNYKISEWREYFDTAQKVSHPPSTLYPAYVSCKSCHRK